jgi:hypothetical protein
MTASMASGDGSPGVEDPFALHIESSRQPVRSQQFLCGAKSNRDATSMHTQSEEERIANDFGKSEGCIVPVKPGNAGGGKAAERLVAGRYQHRLDTVPGDDAKWYLPADRSSLLLWDGHRGEPDALTAQVRFWEGAAAQLSMDRIV